MNIELPRRSGAGSAVSVSLLLLCLAACGGKNAAPAGDAAAGAPPPAEVVVATAQRGDLPLDLTYTASSRGSREVEVRARVSGILLSRHFQEGSFVKKGALLFKIDPAPFKAAAQVAAGNLAVEKARLAQTLREKERILPLFEKNGVSQRERDDAVSAWEIAQANVAAAEARLRQANLELGYTSVTAPLSGYTSKESRSEGSLVQAGSDSSLLTRIFRLDPLYIEFAMPDSEARTLRQLRGWRIGIPVAVLAADGHGVARRATLDFLDSAVDGSSATVRARASLANPDSALLPGEFLRVRLEDLTLSQVVTIETRALVQGPTGPFVWVIGAGGAATMTPVKTGQRSGERVVITEGLAGGEEVVVEGLMKVYPGATVKPVRAAASSPAASSLAASSPAAGEPAAATATGEPTPAPAPEGGAN